MVIMLFSRVKILCLRAKAHLVFHKRNALRFLRHGTYHVVIMAYVGSHFCQSPRCGGGGGEQEFFFLSKIKEGPKLFLEKIPKFTSLPTSQEKTYLPSVLKMLFEKPTWYNMHLQEGIFGDNLEIHDSNAVFH